MRWMWLAIFLSACTGSVTKYKAVPMNDSIADDAISESMIAPYRDSLELSMNTILVQNDVPLTRGIPESTLGNLIADLLLERALIEMPDSVRPLICLINIGGLRVDLPAGPITVGKVFELMPFENELDVVKLSPEKILEMMRYLKDVGGQPVSGVSFSHKAGKNSILTLDDGEEIRADDLIYVVTSDYLAEGGDKMDFFKNPVHRIRTGIKIRDAILDDFRVKGLAGQVLNSDLDGRISVIKF